MIDDKKLREEFEAWIGKPPHEIQPRRYTEDEAWPGQYRDYSAQLAWEAVQEFERRRGQVKP